MGENRGTKYSYQKEGIWIEEQVFHHPLLDVISTHGVTQDFVQRLLDRRRLLCQQAFRANDWLRYILLHQPISRDLALYEIQEIISPIEFLKCVDAIWRDPTSTCGSSDMVAEATKKLSVTQIHETILTQREQSTLAGHSEELQLFRATSNLDFGFVWVNSVEEARAWQETLRSTHLVTGLFQKQNIMAVIEGPYGTEYWADIKHAQLQII